MPTTQTITTTYAPMDVYTDLDTCKLSDSGEDYGVRRDDNKAIVVEDGTDMDKISTGRYTYTFEEPVYGADYEYSIEKVIDGTTTYETGTIGFNDQWVTEDAADSYFADRVDAGGVWASGASKVKALKTAQRQIQLADRWTVPATATGGTPLRAITAAICEQALFVLLCEDVDRRTALQAQGVRNAGVVSEAYEVIRGVPVSMTAISYLMDFRKRGLGLRFNTPQV